MNNATQPAPVRKWTTRNDANHNNRHAEALGVEFFAFPYQSLYARVGWFSAGVADCYLPTGQIFTANVNAVLPNGTVKPLRHARFDTEDEALLWAAQQINSLNASQP